MLVCKLKFFGGSYIIIVSLILTKQYKSSVPDGLGSVSVGTVSMPEALLLSYKSIPIWILKKTSLVE